MVSIITHAIAFGTGAMLGHVFRPLILKAWKGIRAWWEKQPKEPLE